jgi:molybdenum cofactor cytidylyltransferase
MNKTAIIILAAGSSSRLGMPKQFLSFKGKTLIECITQEANKAHLYPVIIVTGANAEKITILLNQENVTVVYNQRWQDGMGSSIRVGISTLLQMGIITDNVIISVCDQPYLTVEIFQKLCAARKETEKGIIASAYADTIGTPVLFSSDYFIPLSELTSKGGAKKILNEYKYDVATVSFPNGSQDIDTYEDYKSLLKK